MGKNAVIKMLREYFAVQLREETSAIDPDRARELFLPFSSLYGMFSRSNINTLKLKMEFNLIEKGILYLVTKAYILF